MLVLSKSETRTIDLADSFFAEVHVDTDALGTKRKIIITNSDYPEVQYVAACSSPQKGAIINTESQMMCILKNADNFKEVWLRKIKEIDLTRKQFE